jgi:hypothetical protein
MIQAFDSGTLELAETSINDTRYEAGIRGDLANSFALDFDIEQFLQCPGSSRRVWEDLSRIQEEQTFSSDASLFMGVGFFIEAIPDADTRHLYPQVPTNPLWSLAPRFQSFEKWFPKRCIFVIDPHRGVTHSGTLFSGPSTKPEPVDHFTRDFSKDWKPEWLRMIKGLDSFGSDTSITIEPVDGIRQAVDLALSVPCGEEGWDADFASELNRVVQFFGEAAVEELEFELQDGQRNTEVIEEVLFQLGTIEHEPTHHKRFLILGQFLKSDSVRFRHMAALGLAEMNDPLAADDLRQAVSIEPSSRLRRNLNRIIEKLERTQECHAF